MTKGFSVLDKIEELKTGKDGIKDQPMESIEIIDTVVVDCPYRLAIASLLHQDWSVHHEARNLELAKKRREMEGARKGAKR